MEVRDCDGLDRLLQRKVLSFGLYIRDVFLPSRSYNRLLSANIPRGVSKHLAFWPFLSPPALSVPILFLRDHYCQFGTYDVAAYIHSPPDREKRQRLIARRSGGGGGRKGRLVVYRRAISFLSR